MTAVVMVAFSLEDFMCSRNLSIEKHDTELEISSLIFDLFVLHEAWFRSLTLVGNYFKLHKLCKCFKRPC